MARSLLSGAKLAGLAAAYLKIFAAGSPSFRWRGDDFKEFSEGESVVEQVSSVWNGIGRVTIR